jgi:poly-gamma-glutamate capsule biosynthesis protein CapA/YwtB (metallophosphatase superfamily)
MPEDPGRRRFLKQATVLALTGLGGCVAGRGSPSGTRARLTLAGQVLMKHPVCASPYDDLAEVIAELRGGDAVFTDLEVAIETPRSGAPTRDDEYLHAAPPSSLDCLREMGFTLLALSNNHAWDLGTAGVLATREAVAEAGFGFAGTGHDLAEASAAGFVPGPPRVALVAAAAGKIREGAAATASRPGVNELRMRSGVPDEADVLRNLRSIKAASAEADYVIAYLHNHDWGDDMRVTRPWARDFARRCIEAGADVFASHGAPLLHGIEFHRGRPVLHGLGSLVFQSRTRPGHYPPEVWESAVVHCDFEGNRLVALQAVPVVLNEQADEPGRFSQTRGRPRLARSDQATRILGRLASLSNGLGTELSIDAGSGQVLWR